MIPLSALGGGARPTGPSNGMPGGGGGGMISLSSLGQVPPAMSPPAMAPPGTEPPVPEAKPENQEETTLAEVGKSAKDYLDVLQPIVLPKGEDDRPIPKQVLCLTNGTDVFKIFDVDMHRFDPKQVKKVYHRLNQYVNPEKLGREPTEADKALHTKLKQAYTVAMDDQLRAVYRQHCFGISGSGGTPALGHEAALAKSLEMGRDLRKAGEDRALVLYKASEVGWSVQQKDSDGRVMRGDTRKGGHNFNLFGDISSSDGEDNLLEKERRNMPVEEILRRSPRYADSFLDKCKLILLDPHVSKKAAGGAFTMLDEVKALDLLEANPKTVQKNLRKIRTAVKQMNWAMTSLLQHKDSPWRGLEVKASLVENNVVKLLEIIRSGISFGKFSETHVEQCTKFIDALHRLYMDLFERRGQELLRGSIKAELTVVYLLPESEGRLPDGSRVVLRDLQARADLNGKGGTVTAWDYALKRYTIDVDQPEAKKEKASTGPENPDLLNMDDMDDADADEAEEEDSKKLDIPKKLMLLPKNALVDLDPAKKMLEDLVKNWNDWRLRPRSVSATQDAEAVAAALGPPLESMAGYLRDASAGVATAAACPDGFDLVADECKEALANARNLAAKLLGEEPKEPPPPPSMTEPPKPLVVITPLDKEQQALKEAAEVASMGIKLAVKKQEKKKKSRSRSRRRRRKSSSSSSSSTRDRKKRKK
eukprot:TRINITY_DN100681_c0_g1_i1.p1 TRINITY_DN100681_c0_g1~~TRINITY_DN100681_c0_g1_i1.p1  ORF type:complete len:705 (-),score=246.35 TRINITY_DN100681_c0_g1_i1:56-2170(-)